MSNVTPRLREFDDYRVFLKAWFDECKTRNPRAMSYRNLSRRAGFSSPNFFKLVMDGKRNLSLGSIGRCVRILHLEGDDAAYFRNLVLFNQAKSEEERALFRGRVELLKNDHGTEWILRLSDSSFERAKAVLERLRAELQATEPELRESGGRYEFKLRLAN